MRFTSCAIATAVLALAGPSSGSALAQGSFEGTVWFTSSEGDGSFAYSIKGNRVRLEPQSAQMPMYMLMDAEAQVMRMVMPGQGMYMEREIPDAKREEDGAELVNTGRTDEVAGRKCEIWTMRDEGGEFEMCIARNMGTFMQGGGPGARRAPPAWQAELRKGGFFPLRIVEVKGSNRKTMLVATKVEAKKLDESMFTVPAGMKKMTMPGGMRP